MSVPASPVPAAPAKAKKPVWKRWWFIALVLLLAIGILNPVLRSEERRVGKSVDLGGRRIIKKKK